MKKDTTVDESSVSRIFGQNVYYVCLDKKKTIKSVEEFANVSSGYISRIRSGKTIGLDTAINICDFLEVNLSDMIDEDVLTKNELLYHVSEIYKIRNKKGRN